MNPDYNDVDTPQNLLNPDVHSQLAQDELVYIIEKNIEKQYKQFDNLGQNIITMFTDELQDADKIKIYENLISHIDKAVVSVIDRDDLNGDNERVLIAGKYIYEFICVDNYASLIPALLELLNITSVDEFDHIINTKYTASPGKFKTDYLTVINTTIEQLLKLQNITPNVKFDTNYQQLLGKYYYYQQLIEYTDITLFLQNYIRPVLSKYASDFIWKLL